VVSTEKQAAEEKSDVAATEVGKENLIVSNDKLAMYPNPVNSILNIKLSSEYKGNAKLRIVDISGQEVKTIDMNKQQYEYINHVTVSGLKPGMYYLSIRMRNGRSLTSRFIKN